MKTLLIALLSLMVGSLALLPDSAEAKRFGGGRSMGQQYSAPPRQATTPRPASGQAAQPARPQTTAGAPARSGASRWLGPLAGLAAGGLLAALLFGDGFEGLQVMDFLLIALLVFGAFLLFRMLRRRAAAGPLPATAGAPVGYRREQPAPMASPAGLGVGAAGAAHTLEGQEAPAWFDPAGFAAGAKAHFIRLQAAWDQNDLAEIRSYTSPELFAELQRERAALGSAPNVTEVVQLHAQLQSVQRDGNQVVASVRFTGLVREDPNAPAHPLDETWHVAHAWDTPAGDWLIVGIQQPEV